MGVRGKLGVAWCKCESKTGISEGKGEARCEAGVLESDEEGLEEDKCELKTGVLKEDKKGLEADR